MVRRAGDGMERESLWRQEVEARLRKLESASPGGFSSDADTTFLRSGRDLEVTGGDIVLDGGRLVAVDGATERTVLNRDRLRLNRADGTRQVEATPAGGLRIYAANGTTLRTTLDGDGVRVGSNVELDADGLHVIGGLVTPSLSEIQINQTTNAALTTTQQNIVTVTMTPPSWAQEIFGFAIATAQVSESSSAKNVIMRIRIGGADFGARTQGLSTSPATESWSAATSISTDRVSLPNSFDVHCRVNTNTGTNDTNSFNLYVFADYRRTA